MNAVAGSKIQLKMIDDIQCPGCIHGTDPDTCSAYEFASEGGFFVCKNWRPSTFFGGIGRVAIGLPRGFNRTGMVEFAEKPFVYIRLYEKPEDMQSYDRFNIPVWAMEKDGYLYVRCYSPRSNWLFVDVVKDGKLEHAAFKDGDYTHKAINVGEFYEETD